MRVTCNQSKKERLCSSELGEGEKADAAKKRSSKSGKGLKTQERELREHLSS